MMVKEYTERFHGFQIRDVNYIGDPPINRPPEYDVVYWYEDGDDEYCCSVGRLIYDIKEPYFDFESIGLRWLECHPSEDVERWLIKWAEYKLEELNNEHGC